MDQWIILLKMSTYSKTFNTFLSAGVHSGAYRRSWYFHSNILDSLTARQAGVQLNPVFLLPLTQAVSESTIFE